MLALLIGLCLYRERRANPSLFDGALALAELDAVLAEEEAAGFAPCCELRARPSLAV